MRITIEVSDCLRAALLQLAAKEGSKGINQIVEEALSHYLVALKRRDRDWGKALKLKGTLSSREADEILNSVSNLRDRQEIPWTFECPIAPHL